jgi:peptide/nickel transport system ATP-binding protein
VSVSYRLTHSAVLVNVASPWSRSTVSLVVLSEQHLVARYRDNQVLHHLSLSIPRGQCLAVVGESGSGKTTLAPCISGIHEQAEGELRFGGEAVQWGARDRTPAVCRAIQYVFQNPYGSLNPRKNVRELLNQPLKQFGCVPDHDPIPELLERVSLPVRYAERYPAQLSGGECQRIASALSLCRHRRWSATRSPRR